MTDLTSVLGAALAGRRRQVIDEPDIRRAAVAIVITREASPALLFVKRLERPGDPWSGHVAFPGGFAASDDNGLMATAAREAFEETGLDLRALGEPLGILDDVFPRSIHLPRVVVTPCAFAVAGRPPVAAGPEVLQAFWVPVAEVFDPANRRPFELHLPGESREFSSIVVAGYTIWGLTERVLSQLATVCGIMV